jgi:hypothetical protein
VILFLSSIRVSSEESAKRRFDSVVFRGFPACVEATSEAGVRNSSKAQSVYYPNSQCSFSRKTRKFTEKIELEQNNLRATRIGEIGVDQVLNGGRFKAWLDKSPGRFKVGDRSLPVKKSKADVASFFHKYQ